LTEQPSSIKHKFFDNKDLILYVGSSNVSDSSEFSPTSGNLYIYKILINQEEDYKEYRVEKLHILPLNGAILDIQIMEYELRKFLLLGVNSTLGVYSLQNSEDL
jgi:hypothetical protein